MVISLIMLCVAVCNIADFLFKFLVIGSAGTGKSCILHQFIEKKCKIHLTCGIVSSVCLVCD